MKMPKPETLRAILPSFGYGPGQPRCTVHVYVETREFTLPAPNGEAYEFIYRCEKTGVERRWGTADRIAMS